MSAVHKRTLLDAFQYQVCVLRASAI